MEIRKILSALALLPLSTGIYAQAGYWQQRADYQINLSLDVQTNRFDGSETIRYTNNSPDTLRRAYFHLYLNAFQPNSDMDIRSRSIPDPDQRVGERIFLLKPEQVGEQKVTELTQDGAPAKFVAEGTILEVELAKPLLPGASTQFSLRFQGQVPAQIRRTGRDNEEGIRYSMSQWYPKLCEYDRYGWHANPYIGREFHGVWGSFDVKLSLDRSYVVAATGVLQNPAEVGHGYNATAGAPAGQGPLTWHFKADNVHDFVWAADPDYKHVVHKCKSGLELHFFYQQDSATQVWKELPGYTERAFDIMARDYGKYPYPVYSVIQGGDGGMEYPMATLITGRRVLGSLVGVTVHELIHSWFQGMLATNEALYPWMDEGFTSFATHDIMAELFPSPNAKPHQGAFDNYLSLQAFGQVEPLTTHADHYGTNYCYGVNAYSKGELVLVMLQYVLGEEGFRQGMKRYFESWKYRHPDPIDFMRVMEKLSGMELDWFFEYFMNTTHKLDYGVYSVKDLGKGRSSVTLARIEPMPMPVWVRVSRKDAAPLDFHIPLDLMRGSSHVADKATILPDWHWVSPTYSFEVPVDVKDILSVEIDPEQRIVDSERINNLMNAEVIKKKPWGDYEK